MPSGLELYKEDGSLAFSTARGDRPCYMLYAIPFVRSEFVATTVVINGINTTVYRKTFAGLEPARMVTLNDQVTIVAVNTLQLKKSTTTYQTIYIMGW